MHRETDKERLKCHFEHTDKLDDMLASKRMAGRYRLKYGKYSKVLCRHNFIWEVEPGFVSVLRKRYGNVTLEEATKKWEGEK